MDKTDKARIYVAVETDTERLTLDGSLALLQELFAAVRVSARQGPGEASSNNQPDRSAADGNAYNAQPGRN